MVTTNSVVSGELGVRSGRTDLTTEASPQSRDRQRAQRGVQGYQVEGRREEKLGRWRGLRGEF